MSLLSSCSSIKVSVDVLTPPLSPAKWPIYTIVYAPDLDSNNLKVDIEAEGMDYNSSFLVNDIDKINTSFNLTMMSVSEESEFLTVYPLRRSLLDSILPSFPYQDTISTFQRVCRAHNADAVVVMDSMNLSVKGVQENDYYQTDYGSYQQFYYTYQKFSGVVRYRVYDCEYDSISAVNLVEDYREAYVENVDFDSLMAMTPGTTQQMNDLSYFLNETWARDKAPRWKQEERTLYIYGSDSLVEAGEYIVAEDWDGAIDIWYGLAEHKNAAIAKKAMYNLALASEIAGDINLAIEWTTKCYEQYHFKPALAYSEILEKRKEVEASLFPEE